MAAPPARHARRLLVLLMGLLAVLLLSAGRSSGQSLFERIVMPGPLIKGHAQYEAKCENCHASFSKSAQDGLCLGCHKEVAGDLKASTGFHGRRTDIAGKPCKHCHTDHKGRDVDIVGLDRDLFDHRLSDFALNGSHQRAECNLCHLPGKKLREAPKLCVDCHKKEDPHKSKLGDKCENCHGETRWRETRAYDHSKTKFPLKGAHLKSSCKACHVGERYKDLAMDCNSCHGLQDVHRGQLGKRCETCHAPEKWTSVKFDHDRNTLFPLTGKHKEAKCESCHDQGAGTPVSAGKGRKQPRTCDACHARDDAHKGQLGKACGNCHNTAGWRKEVAFDHDQSRFPLIGLHSVVPCEECHVTQSYHDASKQCVGCHADNYHKGRLNDRCSECHNPNGWALWQFDHKQRTGAALNGAHAGLDCHGCHSVANRKIGAPMSRCETCHKKDDFHQGAFGPQCGRCHDETDFKNVKIR